jgi:ornithine decarboxylase
MQRCREVAGDGLGFVMEPGRHLVADHGAVRAHVSRLSTRHTADGGTHRWLYLSCGKFNGLYEMDELQYRLVFPTHPDGPYVRATVAGPTCDSDDAYSRDHSLVAVPESVESGDPVWVLSSGAYAVSYMTQGFNGFSPLPYACIRGTGDGPEGPPAKTREPWNPRDDRSTRNTENGQNVQHTQKEQDR